MPRRMLKKARLLARSTPGAKTRFSPSKAATSEEARGTNRTLCGGSLVEWILANEKHPAVLPSP